MIIDSIQNAHKYIGLHPLFKQGFEYIQTTDLENAAIGKWPLAEGLTALFSDGPGKTQDQSLEKFECHNRHIDIQVCVRGQETLGWKPRQDCMHPKGVYNDEKDVLFFEDKPDMYFQLKPGQLAIFYPEDVHAPMIGTGMIKKLVLKVKIDV